MSRLCMVVCLVLLVLVAPDIFAQFQSPTTYPAGASPFSVAVGDLNGDGHPDLAVTNSDATTGNTVSILLGLGDGTFQSHLDYATGLRPTSVLVADFNRDHKMDLAVTTASAGTIGILLGNGDGTFLAHTDYAAGINPQWLVAADFNRDSYLDLAAANYGPDYSGGSVSVFMGRGDGTFQDQIAYPAGTNPFGIMAADFNRDGKVDLAVVDNNGSFGVLTLLGNGDGSFQSPVYHPTGRNPRVGVIADFNSDGFLDLAIANCIDFNVSVLLGDGNGNFATPVNYAASAYVQTLAGADVDGDGKLDLMTANAGANTISVLRGNGDGTFPTHTDFATGAGPMWVTAADLNHDNAPDLLAANSGSNNVTVLLNTGTDFSITASVASPATIQRGASSTSTVSLHLLNTFDNPVNMECSVAPAQSAPSCSLNPNPATFDASGNATVTLTMSTASSIASLKTSWLSFAAMALFGFVLAGTTSNRTRLGLCLFIIVLFGAVGFQAACGGGSGTPPTMPQTYTVTVNATSGATQHSATTTLTVQ